MIKTYCCTAGCKVEHRFLHRRGVLRCREEMCPRCGIEYHGPGNREVVCLSSIQCVFRQFNIFAQQANVCFFNPTCVYVIDCFITYWILSSGTENMMCLRDWRTVCVFLRLILSLTQADYLKYVCVLHYVSLPCCIFIVRHYADLNANHSGWSFAGSTLPGDLLGIIQKECNGLRGLP